MSVLAPTMLRLNFLHSPPLFIPVKYFKNLKFLKKPSFYQFPPSSTSYLLGRLCCSKSHLNKNPTNPDNRLIVLGIETSCDDTAAAIVSNDGHILSQVVYSQYCAGLNMYTCKPTSSWFWKTRVEDNWNFDFVKADLLARYGGVDPKMAEEAHTQVIDQVVQETLDRAKLTEKDLSAVAVTIGPGLSLCLRVGVQKARKIAGCFNLPIVGVHHMEAHALVARIVEKKLQFPFMTLLVSGGHNLLILAHDLGNYVQLGTTVDDAIGEAYDKTAKWLGLDLRKSGGPAVEELAREGDGEAVKFKVPMKQHKDCNFSYAGLKTQVRLAIESHKINADIPVSLASNEERTARANIAASFQRVAVQHLEDKCDRAIEWALKMEPSIKFLVVSGGVASNQYVRDRLDLVVTKKGLQLVCPPPSLCTDNGVMVAWTGIEHFRMGRYDPPPPANEPDDALLDLRPRWPLGEEYAEGRSEARSLRKARIHPSLTSLIQASLQKLPNSAV